MIMTVMFFNFFFIDSSWEINQSLLQEVSPVWLLMDEISAQFGYFEYDDDDYYFFFFFFLLTYGK